MSTRSKTTFDTSNLSPAMLGRLNKHLDKLVRIEDGTVMTFRECYTRPEYTHKRIGRVYKNRDSDEMVPSYVLWRDDETGTDVPKLVFDSVTIPQVES